MPGRPSTQTAFAAALLDPARPVPDGVTSRTAVRPLKRFNVYRNNVVVSLIEALGAAFPVARRLAGEELFRAAARLFVARHPPRSAVLLAYGGAFPDFLSTFAPLADRPHIGDLARLEWAWNEAYHAADAEPLALEALSALTPEAAAEATFTLHPSLRLVASRHPIVSLWEAHQPDAAAPACEVAGAGEDALVIRPELAVEVRRLPVGAVAFIAALAAGRTLRAAYEDALAALPAFDLAGNLAGLMQSRAIVAVTGDG